ncbi:para-nitrobenzyl esterase, putative [Babesia ovata]|uniref:Para-nitrobenzyl esterase, putative n=1 Tax=Babesia ovata TaxID=189622 RepID=A0A2H6K7N8_9APIC|nr:para-nitrobenzyl esterase, putative [Babesia ovata]GBE59005.1 para-nitrobenzyl esterase, putative [Babesia ovata]
MDRTVHLVVSDLYDLEVDRGARFAVAFGVVFYDIPRLGILVERRVLRHEQRYQLDVAEESERHLYPRGVGAHDGAAQQLADLRRED